jgi:hypothetical protein
MAVFSAIRKSQASGVSSVMADFPMPGLYLGEAITLVWLGPAAARRFVADLPIERWRPAGPYQSVAPLCHQPAQAADSQGNESSEFPIRETWYVLRSETESKHYGSPTPRINRSPDDHANAPVLIGDAPKKGWTAETAGVPVTDSVEMVGAGCGEDGLVSGIGPQNTCHFSIDISLYYSYMANHFAH